MEFPHWAHKSPKKRKGKGGNSWVFLRVLPGLGWCLWWGARRIHPRLFLRDQRGRPEGKIPKFQLKSHLDNPTEHSLLPKSPKKKRWDAPGSSYQLRGKIQILFHFPSSSFLLPFSSSFLSKSFPGVHKSICREGQGIPGEQGIPGGLRWAGNARGSQGGQGMGVFPREICKIPGFFPPSSSCSSASSPQPSVPTVSMSMSAARAPPFPEKKQGKSLRRDFQEGKNPPCHCGVVSRGGILWNFGVYEGGESSRVVGWILRDPGFLGYFQGWGSKPS